LKSIEFSEDQLKDIGNIGQSLFGDPSDPRSYLYVRELKRPRLNWFKIICGVVLPPIVTFALTIIMHLLGLSMLCAILIATLLFALYLIVTAKRGAIALVRIYQALAPKSIREKCRFEPSCSEYMVLSIEKYGVLRGVLKGIGRLKRCNVKNGGFDYP
jgi:putative membrane protein insertion efficiency factor